MESRACLFIDKSIIDNNFQLFLQDKPAALKYAVVVKNNGCGLGLEYLSQVAIKHNADFLCVANVEEACLLIKYNKPILIFGERSDAEIDFLASQNIFLQIQSLYKAKYFAKAAAKYGKVAKIHVKIDSGLSRYGFEAEQAASNIAQLLKIDNLQIKGVMSHFAMSDEPDKSFAHKQWKKFHGSLQPIKKMLPDDCLIHICNSGGYLDLPQYHADLCRLGVLFTGNYPSTSCRRININHKHLKSPFKLVSKVSFIRLLKKGDKVGYGMHYTASHPHHIGIVPVGYGDGYPRLKNNGQVLIRGQRINIIGRIAMDSLMVDLSPLQNPKVEEEVVLLGTQRKQEITVYELSQLVQGVVYQILTGWKARLTVKYVDQLPNN